MAGKAKQFPPRSRPQASAGHNLDPSGVFARPAGRITIGLANNPIERRIGAEG